MLHRNAALINFFGSIIEITVESVFLSLFYDHPLVAQEGSELDRLVMAQFYSLPSVAFLDRKSVV